MAEWPDKDWGWGGRFLGLMVLVMWVLVVATMARPLVVSLLAPQAPPPASSSPR